jgi:hypothetical protein
MSHCRQATPLSELAHRSLPPPFLVFLHISKPLLDVQDLAGDPPDTAADHHHCTAQATVSAALLVTVFVRCKVGHLGLLGGCAMNQGSLW